MSWRPVFEGTPRGRFDDHVALRLAEARTIQAGIRQAGAAALLDEWEATDRAGRDRFHRGGRKPWLSNETVLVLRQACAERGLLTYDSITSLICWGMDAATHDALGITLYDGDTPQRIAGRVYSACKRLESIIDPHPRSSLFKRGLRHTGEAFDAYKATLDGELVQARKDRAGVFANALIHVSWLTLPKELREQFKGNVVTDSTFVKAAARGQRTNYGPTDWVSSDPFAGWYMREGDHADTDENRAATGRKSLKKVGWGWELTTVVATPNDPTREATFPAMILGIGLDRPGAVPSELTVKAVRFMQEKGIPVSLIAGDRNYGNHPRADKWAIPLADMGIQQVFDMRMSDLADVRLVDGVAILEGNTYCPLIIFNDELVNAVLDYRRGRKIEDPETGRITDRRISWNESQRLVAERAKYLLRPHGKPGPDGRRRYACPATGDNATLGCRLRPRLDVDDALFPEKNVPPVEYRGGVCNNKSGISTLMPTPQNAIRPDDPTWKPKPNEVLIPRLVQPLQFGSPEWRAHYGTARNIVESVNDTLKNRHSIRFETANSRRARGYSATIVYAALTVLAYNLKRLKRFLAAPPPVDRHGRGKPKGDKKRRRDTTNRFGAGWFWSTAPPPDPDEIPPDSYDNYPEAA